MTFDRLKQMRDDLQDARSAIAEVKTALRQRISATEVKFDPNQPRAPQGTPTGGQWTNTGGGSGQRASARKPSPPPPPPQASPPQTLGNLPRGASRTSLPLIAGAVGIQRAAGTYASAVSGQSMTPFFAYSLPKADRWFFASAQGWGGYAARPVPLGCRSKSG